MLTKQWFIDVNKKAPHDTPNAGKSFAEQGLKALSNGASVLFQTRGKTLTGVGLLDGAGLV